MDLGALIGASPLASLIGIHGQRETNAANAKEAAMNRESMEYLSSTSHQREVKDLEAAGLNPILSANAGASTPGGSQAVHQNPMEALISSAKEASQFALQLQKQREEIGLIRAQKNKANVEATVLTKDIPKAEMINEIYSTVGRPIINKIRDARETNARSKVPSEDSPQRSRQMDEALERVKKNSERFQFNSRKP